MFSKLKEILVVFSISLLPTVFLWIPFFFRVESILGIPLPKKGMATIVENYDGPYFLVVAKTFYDKSEIQENFQLNVPAEYYPAHFPLFPLLIRLASPLFGYPYSMLTVTLISSALAILFFNKLIKEYVGKKNSLWLTFLFSIFPARWLIVRSVGSAEPLFIVLTLASIYYFKNKKYLKAGIFGALAQLTKSPAILVFATFFLHFLWEQFRKISTVPKSDFKLSDVLHFFPIFLIPISLLILFYFYKVKVGDFLAYFHSGDNIHLFLTPFQVFNYQQPWVGTFWLEEIIFIYLIILAGIYRLYKMRENLFFLFSIIFFSSLIFVSHRDISRYALPLIPFLFLAYKDFLTSRESKIIFTFLIIPIYLFSIAFISQNTLQISDWTPFL